MARTTAPRLRVRLRPWLADPHALLALAITVSAVIIELVTDPGGMAMLVPPIFFLLAAQFVGHRLVAARRRTGLDTARLLVAVAAVFWMSMDASTAGAVPLTMLYIPIVTMAAAIGWRPMVVVGAVAVAATVLLAWLLRMALPPGFAEASGVDPTAAVAQRGVTMIATMAVLASGTRRTVGTPGAGHRPGPVGDRPPAAARPARWPPSRRSVALLAASGPPHGRARAGHGRARRPVRLPFVSIYTVEGPRCASGAQRGYRDVIESFDGSIGVIGRVMRTGRAVLVTDVTQGPRLRGRQPEVRSEVSVPLGPARPSSACSTSRATRRAARRVRPRHAWSSSPTGSPRPSPWPRERAALQERAAVFGRLVRFGSAINASLEQRGRRAADRARRGGRARGRHRRPWSCATPPAARTGSRPCTAATSATSASASCPARAWPARPWPSAGS